MRYINGNINTERPVNDVRSNENKKITGNTYTIKYINAKIESSLRKYVISMPIDGRGRVGYAVVA